ncbi:MAG TPA: diversity-generating retroelement protein Avd [Candidatus Saccharimonadales bacterium]|nr:diversity-generating retroelement protein Avd [Candidatus Saccharimonadales bacterium]
MSRISAKTPPASGEKTPLHGSPLDVPIVHNLYQLYQNLHGLVLKFPKSQRYSLGANLQNQLLSALEGVMTAAATNQPTLKSRYLQTVSAKIDLLRVLIRLAKDCQCISNQQYLDLESQLHQIGRMLGGWLKSIK